MEPEQILEQILEAQQIIADPNVILKLDTIIQILKYQFLMFGVIFATLLVILFAKAWLKSA